MFSPRFFSMLLVFPGIVFLLAAVYVCVRRSGSIPATLQKKWRMITLLIAFFVLGYLVFLFAQLKNFQFPVEIITSLVFLGGAFFVFLIINLSGNAIVTIHENELHIGSINKKLLQQNKDLEQEVSARQTAEERARARLQNLAALHAIDMLITSNLDLRVTMKLFLDQSLPRLGMDAGIILLLNNFTQTLEYGASVGVRNPAVKKSRERLGEGTAGKAAFERRTVAIQDLSASGSEFVRGSLLVGDSFESYYAIPLIAKGETKGVFELFRNRRGEQDAEWFELLDALAVQAAIAIDNATLFNRLQQSNVELTLAYDTTIEGWSKALELRDSETEGHTQRVTDLTMRVACALGLKEEELVHVRRGALLHDIGKMAVPDTILMKAGPLTEEEQEKMRQHPTHAFALLSPIGYLRPALDIPYCHHEWWDGTGYPRGLKGAQIPMAARIFTIADNWDALVSDRRYRAAWPGEKVAEYIRSLAGTQFDPDLVEIFLHHV